MSDKSSPERIGIVENRLDEHGKRIAHLETDNEYRKNAIVKAMWWCIRLLLMVTVLTLATDKMKDKWLPIIGALGL